MHASLSLPVDPLHEVLTHHFGYDAFRPGQRDACEALLEGRDVLVLMPTGGGKSLCFQVPAMAARRAGGGLTVVISPLIALMNDQVAALRRRGVHAGALHSGLGEAERRTTFEAMAADQLDLLYVSPERAALSGFRGQLERQRVAFLAVDEAHCISQWGHDFRPEYMTLDQLRHQLGVPTIALTATATPRVANEMVQHLGLRDPLIVRGSFARPGLRFSVQCLSKDSERMEALVHLLEQHQARRAASGRVIVYCATRKKAETVAEGLVSRGFKAAYYHAGRTDAQREKVQRAYEAGRTPVLVATNAFGMGMDQPDVRVVVHFQAPGSLEAYYQEAGRAGRDGLPASCVMFFGARDMVTQRHFAQGATGPQRRRAEEALRELESYVWHRGCRQQFMCSYFTGEIAPWTCGQCDGCCTPHELPEPSRPKKEPVVALDGAAMATIVGAVEALRKPVGKRALAQALRGSEAKALRRVGLLTNPQHGMLAGYNEASIVAGIERLLADGVLERRGQKYPTVWLAGRAVRKGATPGGRPKAPPTLRRALFLYRQQQARALKWKPYMVFTTQVIEQVAERRPADLEALARIRGLGPAKIDRFGADVVRLVLEAEGRGR